MKWTSICYYNILHVAEKWRLVRGKLRLMREGEVKAIPGIEGEEEKINNGAIVEVRVHVQCDSKS